MCVLVCIDKVVFETWKLSVKPYNHFGKLVELSLVVSKNASHHGLLAHSLQIQMGSAQVIR